MIYIRWQVAELFVNLISFCQMTNDTELIWQGLRQNETLG